MHKLSNILFFHTILLVTGLLGGNILAIVLGLFLAR